MEPTRGIHPAAIPTTRAGTRKSQAVDQGAHPAHRETDLIPHSFTSPHPEHGGIVSSRE